MLVLEAEQVSPFGIERALLLYACCSSQTVATALRRAEPVKPGETLWCRI